MGTISARVPEEIERALEEYIEAEHLDRSTAIRKLLAEGLADWRRDRALSLLADNEITLSRAAEIADTTVWDIRRTARERDIAWVADGPLSDDIEDL